MQAPICIRPAKPADAGLISRIIERRFASVVRWNTATIRSGQPLDCRQSADVISARLADSLAT
jgi:hypothetical protein